MEDIADGQASQKFHSVNLLSLCLLQFIFSSVFCQGYTYCVYWMKEKTTGAV